MNREELYIYGDGETATYSKSEADSVMDAMEVRIKELESQLENVQNTMYTENVDANMSLIKANERIKELEDSKHFLLRKVKEYMDEKERLKAIIATNDESSATEKENG